MVGLWFTWFTRFSSGLKVQKWLTNFPVSDRAQTELQLPTDNHRSDRGSWTITPRDGPHKRTTHGRGPHAATIANDKTDLSSNTIRIDEHEKTTNS